jgi:hypothetical protein
MGRMLVAVFAGSVGHQFTVVPVGLQALGYCCGFVVCRVGGVFLNSRVLEVVSIFPGAGECVCVRGDLGLRVDGGQVSLRRQRDKSQH